MVKSDIDYLASLEEISWRQKSKTLFIKEGDNNTWFFHRMPIPISEPIRLGKWRWMTFVMRMS